MKFFYVIILLILFIIINSKRNIKELEALVIERKGKIYRIITKKDKNVIIVPFIDKVIKKVDLNNSPFTI